MAVPSCFGFQAPQSGAPAVSQNGGLRPNPDYRLFIVVFLAAQNCHTPVELFRKENPDHLVAKGHF